MCDLGRPFCTFTPSVQEDSFAHWKRQGNWDSQSARFLRMCERGGAKSTDAQRVRTEGLFLCAIWDVPFAHPATLQVRSGTSLSHIRTPRSGAFLLHIAFVCPGVQ